MDKNTFSRLMEHPESLTPDEWVELRAERDRFPFSAPLQVLSLMADKANGTVLWEKQSLPRVMLYVQQPACLVRQLDAMSQADTHACQPEMAPTRPPEPERAAAPENGDSFDVLKEINAYQEVSFKTAPKSVILTNFLENDAGMEPIGGSDEAVSVQELAEKSILPNSSLESETLAIILEKQGKYAQALAMYEKLILNNPEKSSTFAVRISALKAQLFEFSHLE